MFALTYRLPLPRPQRADRTILPAVICGVLAVMIVLQVALPRRLDLPEPGVVRPFHLDPPIIATRGPEPIIAQRALFSAARTVSGGTAASVQPLDGATAAGLSSRRGATVAFIQSPGGAVTTLAPGQSYHGWQLVHAAGTGLAFRHGGQLIVLPLTSAATVVSDPAAPR